MDIVAAICAAKHCESQVVTASVDNVSFRIRSNWERSSRWMRRWPELYHLGRSICRSDGQSHRWHQSQKMQSGISYLCGYQPGNAGTAAGAWAQTHQQWRDQTFWRCCPQEEIRLIQSGRMKPSEAKEVKSFLRWGNPCGARISECVPTPGAWGLNRCAPRWERGLNGEMRLPRISMFKWNSYRGDIAALVTLWGDIAALVTYGVTLLRSSHYGVTLPRSSHYGVTLLRSSHYGVTLLRSSHYGVTSLRSSLYGVTSLRSSLYGVTSLRSSLYEVTSLRSSLYGVTSLRSSHYGVTLLRSSLYGVTSLRSSHYGVTSLRSSHYGVTLLRSSLYGVTSLRSSHYGLTLLR